MTPSGADILGGATSRVLRQFAGACLVVFGALAARAFVQGRPWAGMIHGVLALALGVGGLVRPDGVRIVYLACLTLVSPVGRVVSEVLLVCLFYGVLTPVALVFKGLRRDALARRADGARSTYWTRKPMPEDVRRYLRQF
jgi:hypothetical protein